MAQQTTGRADCLARDVFRWSMLLVLFSISSLLVLAEEATTFIFSPPDGLTYTETTRTKNTTAIVAGSNRMTEATEQILKTKTEINKSATGYTIIETVLSVDETKDGKDTDPDSFLLASVGIPVTYHIGKDGKLLSVDGIDNIVASCKKTMAEDEQRSSGYLITAKGILDANKASWYEDTQSLIGRTVKTGSSWKFSVTYPMPNGKSDAVLETITMIGKEENNGHDGVRLHYVKRHDQKALAEARAFFFKELLTGESDKGKQPQVSIKQATEEGDDVVDPMTLQSLSSTSNSTIVTVLTGGDDEKMEITETTDEETSVDYNPGAFTGLPMMWAEVQGA